MPTTLPQRKYLIDACVEFVIGPTERKVTYAKMLPHATERDWKNRIRGQLHRTILGDPEIIEISVMCRGAEPSTCWSPQAHGRRCGCKREDIVAINVTSSNRGGLEITPTHRRNTTETSAELRCDMQRGSFCFAQGRDLRR